MTEPITAWSDYLAASSLTRTTAIEFGERIRAFRQPPIPAQPFAQPGAERPLRTPRDGLQRLLRRRTSGRDFASKALTVSDLEKIFAAFSADEGRRSYASAGGLYPIHVCAFVLRSESPWQRTAIRYEPVGHALGVLVEDVDVVDVESACNLEPDIHPQMILVFVAHMDDARRKYGERAGRFALIEVGEMAQALAMRLAKSGLRGYQLGGIREQDVKTLLGLSTTAGEVLHAYACGR